MTTIVVVLLVVISVVIVMVVDAVRVKCIFGVLLFLILVLVSPTLAVFFTSASFGVAFVRFTIVHAIASSVGVAGVLSAVVSSFLAH